MDNIIVDTESTSAHQLFTTWLNGEMTSPTSGFWSELVTDVVQQLAAKRVVLLLQEFYDADRITLLGFGVFSDMTAEDQKFFYFNSEGKPLYYAISTTEIINVSETGEVVDFTSGPSIALINKNGEHEANLSLYLEKHWGAKLPMLRLTPANTSWSRTPKGLLDVDYATRDSGAYLVYVDPSLQDAQIRVVSVSDSIITVSVPIFKDYHIDFGRMKKGEAIYVPKTPRAEEYLRDLKEKGLVRYFQPVV